MNEITLSVDLAPALNALCGGTALSGAESQPPVLPQPSAMAVEAFQSAMSTLVADNQSIQSQLEAIVARPLDVPARAPVAQETKPVVALEAKPVVAAKPLAELTPEIVKQFAETIAPLVAENREVQVALEKIVPLPLTVPEVAPVVAKEPTTTAPTPVAEPQPGEARQPVAATVRDAVAPEAKPGVAPETKPVAAPETKPVAAAKPLVEVTPEIVKRFAETIAPLVAENREVQVALETAMVRPLTAPELKPATKTESANESEPLPSAGEDVVLQAVPVVQEAVADVVRPEAVQPTVAGIAATGSAPKIAPTPAEVLIVAAEAVADTIMVTPGLLSGEGRIHVQLKPDVLGGTEIQLNVTGRTIAVEFQPQTVEMGALIQRCLPQLEQHLAAKIHSFTIAATVNQSRRRKV